MSSTATGCWRSPPTTAARRWSSAPSSRTATPGRPIDFWDLWLPRETRAYVPKLLAMKRLVLDPGGLRPRVQPDPEPALLRARRHARPDQPQARRRDRRHDARGALRAQPGVPSLGHRPDRARINLLLPIDAADVFCENITQLTDRPAPGSHALHGARATRSSRSRSSSTPPSNVDPRAERPADAGGLTVGDDLRVPSRGHGAARRRSCSLPRPGRRPCAARRRRTARSDRAARAIPSWSHRAPPRHECEHAGLDERHASWRSVARRPAHHAPRPRAAPAPPRPRARRLSTSVREGDTVPADRAAVPVQRSAAARLEWPETHSHHVGQKLRIQLTRVAAEDGRGSSAPARPLSGIIAHGGINHGISRRQTRTSSWASRPIAQSPGASRRPCIARAPSSPSRT